MGADPRSPPPPPATTEGHNPRQDALRIAFRIPRWNPGGREQLEERAAAGWAHKRSRKQKKEAARKRDGRERAAVTAERLTALPSKR